MRLLLDNQNVYLEEVPRRITKLLSKRFSYRVAGAQYASSFQSGNWDGRKHLISMLADGRLRAPAGLATEIAETLSNNGHDFEFLDARRYSDEFFDFSFDESILRPYQLEAVKLLTTSRGPLDVKGRAIIKLPPRSGKTLIGAAVIARFGVRTLFVVPAQFLLHQSVNAISSALGTEVGLIGEGVWKPGPITVTTIQSLLAKRNGGTKASPSDPEYIELMQSCEMVVMDECFPAGTMVGNKPIEQIVAGDLVLSFDEKNQVFNFQKVTRTFEQKCHNLVRLRFVDNRSIVCTPNHPFFTKRGWIKAVNLTANDMVLYTTCYDKDGMHEMWKPGRKDPNKKKRLLRKVPIGKTRRASKKDQNKVHLVQSGRCCERRSWFTTIKKRSRLLLRGLQKRMEIEAFVRSYDSDEQKICIEKNERTKSDERPKSSSKAKNYFEDNGLEAFRSRWKWKGNPIAATDARNNFRLGARTCSSNENAKSKRGIPNALQNRYCRADIEDCNRSGWFKSQPFGKKKAGQNERPIFDWVGLESIEILKPGSDGTFGGLCRKGFVYNLEIENTHTYFANGLVVHNCHHLEGDQWRKVIQDSMAPYKIGLSATVFLDHEKECELGVIWLHACTGDILLDIPVSDLIEQGYLVKPDIWICPIRHPVFPPNRGWSQRLQKQAIFENDHRNDRIVRFTQYFVRSGRRPVIIANRHSQVFALQDKLENAGLSVGRIIGQTKRPERESIVEAFRQRRIDVLLGTVFGEGVDIPEIDTVVVAEGGAGVKQTYQRLRCMTPHDTKEDAIVVDFMDLTHPYFSKHSLERLSVYQSERAFSVRVVE